MQLLEMETRGWWVIEDDATTPSEITAAEMIALINQAVQDIGQDLNIVKSATITLTATPRAAARASAVAIRCPVWSSAKM